MTITILGLDPGTNSFAYSGIRFSRKKLKVLQQGMIHSTLRTLTVPALLRQEHTKFREAITSVLKAVQPDLIIAERYMLRRGQGGTAIESINMMLGVLLELDLPIKIIPSSQWKNACTRAGIPLEEIYPRLKPDGFSPHQIDASHIAVFGLGVALKMNAPYDQLEEALIKSRRLDYGQPFVKPKKRRKARKAKP